MTLMHDFDMPKHLKIANQVTNINLLHRDDYPEMPKNTTTIRYGCRELLQHIMSAIYSRHDFDTSFHMTGPIV